MPAAAQLIDLDRSLDIAEEIGSRRAILDERDREHGGMRSLDVELVEEERKRSMQGWERYRSEVTMRERRAAERGEPAEDPRCVSIGRLQRDISRAVERWGKLRNRDDRELLKSDALLLLLQLPEQGSDPEDWIDPESGESRYPNATRIDLGGRRALRLAELRRDRELRSIAELRDLRAARRARAISVLQWIDALEEIVSVGTLPLRRDWIDPERRDRDGFPMNTPAAQAALRAIVSQAKRNRYWRAEKKREQVTELRGLDLDSEVEEERREQLEAHEERDRVPPLAAPEVIAELLDLPLDAGRAIVARCEVGAHSSGALRELWGMSESAYPVAISRGGRMVAERYPDGSDLLDALEDLPERYLELCERGAVLALIDHRDGWIEREVAERAVVEWRSAIGSMRDDERALLGAAREALRREALRAGLPSRYGSEDALRIAEIAERLLPAEQHRAQRGGRLRSSSDLAATYPEELRSLQREPLPEELRKVRANLAEELRRLLDKGSSEADRIAAIRAELRSSARPGAHRSDPEGWLLELREERTERDLERIGELCEELRERGDRRRAARAAERARRADRIAAKGSSTARR